MTQTLTTERLREIVEDGFLEHGDAKSMARELLANREAQPVAYLKKSIIDSERFDSADPEIILHPNTPEGWLSEYQAVFTAQPAPAVPGEKPKLDYKPSMSWGDQCVAIAEIRGWNACRAAMLAAAPEVDKNA